MATAHAKTKEVLSDDARLEAICRPIFDEMDKDKSGQIDAKEFEGALAKMAKQNGLHAPTKKDVAEYMKSYDINQDGTISFEEFLEVTKGTLKKAAESQENKGAEKKIILDDKNFNLFVSQAFEVIDKEKLGTVDVAQLAKGLEEFGILIQLPAQKEKLQRQIEKYDSSKDKRIDVKEFSGLATELFNIELLSDKPGDKKAKEAAKDGSKEGSKLLDKEDVKVKEEPPRQATEEEKREAEKLLEAANARIKLGDQYIQYIEETGLAMAFKIIFAEILSKKIPEDAAFAYTATRLRQIGDDIAYIQDSKYKKFIAKTGK